MSLQLSLDEALQVALGRCRYGIGSAGYLPGDQCTRPATHRAVWVKPTGERGGVDCCVLHADYYAGSWAYYAVHHNNGDTVWIEVLARG